MRNTLPDEALNQLLREARTHTTWLEKPVSDEVLRQLYDLVKWGPTSANVSPARFVFLRTPESGGDRSRNRTTLITSDVNCLTRKLLPDGYLAFAFKNIGEFVTLK